MEEYGHELYHHSAKGKIEDQSEGESVQKHLNPLSWEEFFHKGIDKNRIFVTCNSGRESM